MDFIPIPKNFLGRSRIISAIFALNTVDKSKLSNYCAGSIFPLAIIRRFTGGFDIDDNSSPADVFCMGKFGGNN